MVWREIAGRKAPKLKDSDDLDRERNGNVTVETATSWNQRNTSFKSSFLPVASMPYPVAAQVTFSARHAEWKVTWTRNASKPEVKPQPAENLSNKLSFLSKLTPTTKDLHMVMSIYHLLSNYACQTGRTGSLPVIEFSTSWRMIRQTSAMSEYKDILSTWIQRILDHEWLDDQVVMSVSDSKFVPKPSDVSKELSKFLIDTKIALGSLSPSYSWVEGRTIEPAKKKLKTQGVEAKIHTDDKGKDFVKWTLNSTGRLEMADVMKLALWGIVVSNALDCTSSQMYVQNGGHAMMRLLSDAMTVRILNDLGSLLMDHWRNFFERRRKTSVPVFFNIGYKERSATSTKYLPGIHVNIRPNESDMDKQYWNKLILRKNLVPVHIGKNRWFVHKSLAESGSLEHVVHEMVRKRQYFSKRQALITIAEQQLAQRHEEL